MSDGGDKLPSADCHVIPAFIATQLSDIRHPTSARRVLEKAGYVREGCLRHSAVKDGELVDELIYAVVRG
jgi:hypothetical protein